MMKRLYISLILLVVAVVLHAQNIPSGYYNGITNQTGTTLKAALHNIIKNDDHTTYSGLWTAYYQTDKRGTNKVWDIYSDNPGGQLPYEYVLGDNQCGGYNGEGSCYNREHLWAQSWTNNDSNEKTDLHHVYPTDGYVNSQRSNYAFGEVGTASWTSLNGGKLGVCKTSGYTGTVFEPIDEYKGDIARALMYVSVRYYTEDSGWDNSAMSTKSAIKDWAISMLLRWHAEDPVSDKEIARNEAVYGIQGNRNPFVDHPEYAAAIWAPNSSYQITASVSPSNAGTVSGAGSYAAGHTCTLTATPNAGYSFVDWTKNNTHVSSDISYTFTVTEAANLQANFINNAVSSSQTIASLTLNGKVTVWSGQTLTVTGTITQPEGSSIVLNNTGQLVNTTPGISAKVKKNITKWAASPVEGWHAISTPVNNVTFANVTNLTPTGSYNVYRLNETTMTWENCFDDNNVFDWFDNGRGYLYRKGNNTAIEFNGILNVGDIIYPLTYTSSTTKGFHLIGNPYPHNIYKGDGAAIPNTWLEDGFYTITSAGGFVAGSDNFTAIAPCQAIVVQAKNTVTDEYLTIKNIAEAGAKRDYDDNIMFVVSNSNYEDVAYAVFKEGHGLNKIEHRNDKIQKLYIQYGGEDFAIADIGEKAKVFNLNFHAATMGKYTMKVNKTGSFKYLHLIDLITGDDIDLLLEDEYSFMSSSSDKDSRFVVKFRRDDVYSDSDEQVFAYQSGNEIVIDGEGELQVFDIMGHLVSTRYINGIERVPETYLVKKYGVYIFRLIGNEVKTQKIIVK